MNHKRNYWGALWVGLRNQDSRVGVCFAAFEGVGLSGPAGFKVLVSKGLGFAWCLGCKVWG